ncbi:gypsy type transposase [Tanacetum coccineum]
MMVFKTQPVESKRNLLAGVSVPDYILNPPKEVMSSLMDTLIMPMIQNLEMTVRSGAVPQAPQFRLSPVNTISPTTKNSSSPVEIRRSNQKEKQIKNLEALLEAEADMKKAAEAKNAELQVSTLHAQITSEEKIKAAFEEFKKYEDDSDRSGPCDEVLARPASGRNEMWRDPRAKTSICECLSQGPPRAERSEVPVSGSAEGFKGCPYGVNYGVLIPLEKTPERRFHQWIHDLRPSISQLKIHVYPEVRDPRDPWAIKDEILLEDAIAANVRHTEKKNKCQVVCRTHEVGSSYHARSDGVPVSAPTVAPQGLAILLADASTQTEISKGEASPRLLRSMFLPAMYNLDWP